MAQLVRGEQEPVSPQPEEATSPGSSSASKETYHEDSDGNHSNVGHPKKPAWSKPLNGVVSVGGPVMGDAVSWPALSEATKAPSKSTPDFSNPSESIPASQVSFAISVCLCIIIIMCTYYNIKEFETTVFFSSFSISTFFSTPIRFFNIFVITLVEPNDPSQKNQLI